MKYYTLEDITALKPCYGNFRIRWYMRFKRKVSLTYILNSAASNTDKLWLVIRLLPKDKASEFAQWCADRVSHLADVASDAAAYAAYAARAAASAADATSYTPYAAGAAARAAYAAEYAAEYAANASDAASDAVYNEARQQQVTQLKLIVKENKL